MTGHTQLNSQGCTESNSSEACTSVLYTSMIGHTQLNSQDCTGYTRSCKDYLGAMEHQLHVFLYPPPTEKNSKTYYHLKSLVL